MAPLALLSVSDKTGLVELAQTLVSQFGFDIISSGGTAKALQAAGLPVTKVSDYTGSPEILGGRVKTLHPRIHGGILAQPNLASHQADLEANQIRPIDLVVVNLYPFTQTIAKPDVTLAEAVEQIDIGGPAMIRAAAKNFAHLTVLSNPSQYAAFVQEWQTQAGNVSLEFRQACALSAFEHTGQYDAAIAAYLAKVSDTAPTSDLPQQFSLSGTQVQALRYGENPHQAAAWYQTEPKGGWAAAQQLQGKELSYNNLVDLEAARAIIAEFVAGEGSGSAAATIIKHNNPCGSAMAATVSEAFQKALQADKTSAFGGIVALNQPVDAATATALTQIFLECVVAPEYSSEAQQILQTKPNLRVLALPQLDCPAAYQVKNIAGGFLVQAADTLLTPATDWQIVTQKQPTPEQLAELLFAWKICKHVKSNAIVVAKHQTTIGVGAGQMNRVGSVQIALTQAAANAQGAVLASDGFFPFDDSVRTAAAAGIVAIVQPGGSVKDADSIKAADELGIVMAFTQARHFLH
jgi:phosphoribosylaminoimidazolecarboxamide formyltransferase / IMP cyclohydrolase